MGEAILLIGGIIKDAIAGFQQILKAKQERDIAALNNRTRLLQDKESNNAAWEMAALQDSDRWLKRISFAIFSAPFICAIFDPQGVAEYFRIALAAIPDWYAKSYMGIVGSVWGIASLKDAIPAIVNQVKNVWKDPDKN
jgi:hypothetical protein